MREFAGEISGLAFGLALLGLLSSFGSALSVTGRTLSLRKTPFWALLRWGGLGLWLLGLALSENGGGSCSLLELFGACCLLVGSARQVASPP